MVPCWWPAAPDVIWHIYSHLHYSMGGGGRESPSSGEAALTMGQVPCEFWADWPRFTFFRGSQVEDVPHQWPVALAVIWHIYSCLAYSLEDSAKDLPSSGKVVLGWGQVPYEFRADWPRFSFQGIWAKGLSSPAPPDSWAWCTFSSSRHNLAHLLAPLLLLEGWW